MVADLMFEELPTCLRATYAYTEEAMDMQALLEGHLAVVTVLHLQTSVCHHVRAAAGDVVPNRTADGCSHSSDRAVTTRRTVSP